MAADTVMEQTVGETGDAGLPAAISHDNLEKAAALKRITTALSPLPTDALLAFTLDLEARPPAPSEEAIREEVGDAGDEDGNSQCVDTDEEGEVGVDCSAIPLGVSVCGWDGTGSPGGESDINVMVPHARLQEFHWSVADHALSWAEHAMQTMRAELEAAKAAGQDSE